MKTPNPFPPPTPSAMLTLPQNWGTCTVTFRGTIDPDLNVQFATLGHRVRVEQAIEQAIEQPQNQEQGQQPQSPSCGTLNRVTIYRVPGTGRSFFLTFLAMMTDRYSANITFQERRRGTTLRDYDESDESIVPGMLTDGWKRLIKALRGTA